MEKKTLMEELEQLGKLYQAGVFSQAEFEAQRAELLEQLRVLRSGQTPMPSKEGGSGIGQVHGADAFATGFVGVREQSQLAAGQVMGGRYRLVRMLGRGGMGDVWLAEETRSQRVFALKFLAAELVGSSEALSRMHREYEVLEKLTHPHIVRVFDIDQDDASGRWYLRMEYVEGEEMGKKIALSLREAKRPLFSLQEMGVWLGQLVDALGYMHQRGILHRDIKPTNLMLTSEQELKVMDFGIARVVSGTHATQHTAMMGSMYYAAPELLRGQAATPAADIYSFGVLVYEMLTGRQPAGRFPMPSRVVQGLSDAVDEAVESMLAMEPSERPASIRDAWHQLQRSFSAQATTARAEVVVAAPKVEMLATAPKVAEPSAGERKIWTLGGVDFAMRWIPAGTFWMGAGADDKEAGNSEKPQHEVTLTRGFWMGETPVAQGQYQTIMGQNPSHFKKAVLDAPVECVSWYDAAAFANKLSALEGLSACFVGTGQQMNGVGNKGSDYVGSKGWRLPTETEWEYACRAGTTSPRFGDLDKIAWYEKNSGRTTYAVGQQQANAWGLHDTLGNVWEWCYDWYGDYSTQAAADPVGAATGTARVERGGGWNYGAYSVRAARRAGDTPTNRRSNLGFRVVRSSL